MRATGSDTKTRLLAPLVRLDFHNAGSASMYRNVLQIIKDVGQNRQQARYQNGVLLSKGLKTLCDLFREAGPAEFSGILRQWGEHRAVHHGFNAFTQINDFVNTHRRGLGDTQRGVLMGLAIGAQLADDHFHFVLHHFVGKCVRDARKSLKDESTIDVHIGMITN